MHLLLLREPGRTYIEHDKRRRFQALKGYGTTVQQEYPSADSSSGTRLSAECKWNCFAGVEIRVTVGNVFCGMPRLVSHGPNIQLVSPSQDIEPLFFALSVNM